MLRPPMHRLGLGVLVLFAALAATAEPRPMTPEDLWFMHRVGTPALSPDGRWVVFPVTVYTEDDGSLADRGNSDLWLVPTDGSAPPRRLTWNDGSDGSPVWSPDGSQIAFVSKRGDGPSQLYRLPLAGGEAQPVTDLPVAVTAPHWFPDGRRIGFLARTWPDLDDDFEAVGNRLEERKKDPVKAKISENRLLRFWDHYKTDGRFAHLFTVDLETGKVRDLIPGSRRLMGLFTLNGGWDLAPDGREAAFSANSTEPPYRQLNYDIFTVTIDDSGAGGEVRNVTAGNPASDNAPRYSPDGKYLIHGRNRRPEIHPDFTRLARLDRQGGESRELASGWDGQPASWVISPDSSTIYFHGQERGRTGIYAVPMADGPVQRLVQGGVTAGVRVAGDTLVFRQESLTAPAELFQLKIGADDVAEPQALTAVNGERLAELDLGTTGEFTFTGAGGDQVHMLVVYPPGFDRAKKWPLLHIVHGGPHGAFQDRFHYRWNQALFASPGYVVAAVNFHGSTGYGQAFAESLLGNHAEKPFEDIMKATDHLIAQGFIDERRMAAAGGSYGGYMVSWILGHTDRFAALINHAGVYDLMSQFASDYTWGRPQNYGASPWTDPARVDAYSPSRFANRFSTPTLILHGEKDYRVPVTQGINLYGVLQGKGVPTRIVVFPDENHWILKAHNAQLWWQEVFDWLEHHFEADSP